MIEISVPKIPIWHDKVCQVMINSDHKGQIFLSNPYTNNRLFSCSPINAVFLYYEKAPLSS